MAEQNTILHYCMDHMLPEMRGDRWARYAEFDQDRLILTTTPRTEQLVAEQQMVRTRSPSLLLLL